MKIIFLLFIFFIIASCGNDKPLSIKINNISESSNKNVFDIEVEFENLTSLDLCITDFWWAYPPNMSPYFYFYDMQEKKSHHFIGTHLPNMSDSLRMKKDTGLLDGYKARRMTINNSIILNKYDKKIVKGKLVRSEIDQEYFKKGFKMRIEYCPQNIDYTQYREFIYLIRHQHLHFLNFSDTIYSNFVEVPF